MLDGPERARKLVTSYLEWYMSDERMEAWRAHFDVDDVDLSRPEAWQWHQRPIGDVFPLVQTVGSGTSGFSRYDYDQMGNPIYNVAYELRTFVWVVRRSTDHTSGDGSEKASRSRDMLTTVVTQALLDRLCAEVGEEVGIHGVRVDEGTIRHEYSQLEPLKSGAGWLAGAFVSFTFNVLEVVTEPPLGEVEQVTVEGFTLLPDS